MIGKEKRRKAYRLRKRASDRQRVRDRRAHRVRKRKVRNRE